MASGIDLKTPVTFTAVNLCIEMIVINCFDGLPLDVNFAIKHNQIHCAKK